MEEAIKDRLQIMSETFNSSSSPNEKDKNENNKTFNKSLVTELILDGYSIKNIKQEDENVLKDYSNLSKLTMNQTELKSLKNFPYSKSLKILELTDNFIQNDLNILCERTPNVQKLELGGNHIKSIEEIEKLSNLLDLVELGLDLNPVSSENDFKQKIWKMFPKLKVLDGCDKDGNEVEFNTEEEEAQDVESNEDTTLRGFYEKEYNDDDDEDDEDFAPDGEGEEDSDIDEDDENDDAEEDDENDDAEDDDENDDAEDDDENDDAEDDDEEEDAEEEEEEKPEIVSPNKRKSKDSTPFDKEDRKKTKHN